MDRRDRLAMRLLVVITPVIATFATFVASSDWLIWVLPIVVLGAVECARNGESNVGLGIVIVLALHWIAAVEDRTSPWVLVVAVCIAVFHTAMAASGVAPSAARWSHAMRVRWARRLAIVVALTALSWVLQTRVEAADLEGSVLVLATALVVLTLAGLALRARALRPSWR